MSSTGGLAGILTRTLRRGSSLFLQSSGKTGRATVGAMAQEAEAKRSKEVEAMRTKEAGKRRSGTKASKGRYGGRSMVAGAGKTTQEVQVSLPPTSAFLLKGLLKLGQQASHRSLQACQGPMAGLHRTRTSHPCQENSICLLLFVFK